jgi:hypothetical protein
MEGEGDNGRLGEGDEELVENVDKIGREKLL